MPVKQSQGQHKRIDLELEMRRETAVAKAGGRGSKSRAKAIAAAKGDGKTKPKKITVAKIDPRSPWAVRTSAYPRDKHLHERLRFCLRWALLAPSSHNTQPWRFRVKDGAIEVLADRTRALPVADPHDRELTISVGCALYFLRVAMRRFGLGEVTTLTPVPERRDLLAVVRPRKGVGADDTVGQGAPAPVSMDALRLFDAIPLRRTVRRAFEKRDVPAEIVGSLRSLAQGEGVRLAVVAGDDARHRLASLVAEADTVQLGDPSFRRELALWMHHNRTHAHDGVPGFAMGMSELASVVAPLVVRTFDVGAGRAAHDRQLAEHSPLLLVLGTDHDGVQDWLRAGQALAGVLLMATSSGLSASYLNQPCELPQTRAHLHRLAPEAGAPQIVLRVGYAPDAVALAHTPRRTLEEVLLV